MLERRELDIQLSFLLLEFLDLPLDLVNLIVEFLTALEGVSVIIVSKRGFLE